MSIIEFKKIKFLIKKGKISQEITIVVPVDSFSGRIAERVSEEKEPAK